MTAPVERPDAGAPRPPHCVFCGSAETELMSLFGSSPLTSQYYCRACRSAFEQVKWGTAPPARVAAGASPGRRRRGPDAKRPASPRRG
ncbi:MAG TPA: hypothetical protein VKW09_06900 [bacterium]|nr:hypothetical protein [bacterium]